jgi:hypothetical protein
MLIVTTSCGGKRTLCDIRLTPLADTNPTIET